MSLEHGCVRSVFRLRCGPLFTRRSVARPTVEDLRTTGRSLGRSAPRSCARGGSAPRARKRSPRPRCGERSKSRSWFRFRRTTGVCRNRRMSSEPAGRALRPAIFSEREDNEKKAEARFAYPASPPDRRRALPEEGQGQLPPEKTKERLRFGPFFDFISCGFLRRQEMCQVFNWQSG